MILELECECLNVYKRKVDQTRKYKADLHQQLAEVEAEASTIISALGERELYAQVSFHPSLTKFHFYLILIYMLTIFFSSFRYKNRRVH